MSSRGGRTAIAFALTLLALVLCGDLGFAQSADAQAEKLPESLRPDNFGAKEITATNTTLQQLHIADWLGPLAPVALSPFFGMACLSAFSIWGGDWLGGNSLLAAAGPLKSELVFGAFVLLTLLTSLPRMTKVSKPFAQAMDQLEAYSVIVILVIIKFMGASTTSAIDAPDPSVQFASFSITTDGLIALAMVINLFVINSVKFFFEILIWLTPIPAIDALFEVCNKLLCAALMGLYAFSPTLATVVNLLVLVAALFVFRWANRQLIYYRTMLMDPVLALLWKPYGQPTGNSFIAFARDSEPFVAKSRWRIVSEGDSWQARRLGWFGIASEENIALDSRPEVRRGWIIHTLSSSLENGKTIHFNFSRRFDGDLGAWVKRHEFELIEQTPAIDANTPRTEFG
ncbi:MAG: hypothetical protein AAFU85_15635 [Planctomycetota bacterium]